MRFRFDNMDAATSAFFSRSLEHIRAQAYEHKFAELDGRQFVRPINERVHPGANVYTYRKYTKVGYAAWATDYSKGPRVDLFGEEASSFIAGIKVAYGHNLQEARAAMMQQLDLNGGKATAARRANDQLQDQAIWTGDGPNLLGLLNQTGVTAFTPDPGKTSGSSSWVGATPREILADLFGIENAIINGTLNVERPNVLALPRSRDQLISQLPMGDGMGMVSVKQFFLANSSSIKTIKSTHRLESEDAAYGKNVSGKFTGCRMVAYNDEPDKLGYILPLEFTQLPPQYDGYEVITHCESRCGGVVAPFPAAMAYGDNI